MNTSSSVSEMRLPVADNHARQAALAAWRTSAIDLPSEQGKTAKCKFWLLGMLYQDAVSCLLGQLEGRVVWHEREQVTIHRRLLVVSTSTIAAKSCGVRNVLIRCHRT